MHATSVENTTPVATIPHLPDEILSYIFRLGHRSYYLGDPASEKFLFLVTSVCRYWRTTGISDPQLWSVIWYSTSRFHWHPNPATRDPSKAVVGISWFLTRSKDVSLDFGLYLTKADGGITIAVMKTSPSASPSRCRNIRLDIYHDDKTTIPLLFPLPGRMDRLLSLHVLFPYPRADQTLVALVGPENASPLGTLDYS